MPPAARGRAAGRGGAVANRAAAPSRSPVRAPGTPSVPLSHRNSPRQASASGGTPRRPISQLRSEAAALEALVREREAFYAELADEADMLARALGGESGATPAGTPMAAGEEVRLLTRRNAQLRRELREPMEAERRCGTDPRVLDRRNEVRAVQRQFAAVEKEIETLETVRRRRDGALKEIDCTEQQARAVRGQQLEAKSELRTELRTLLEEQRRAEREDLDTRERHARLQDQIKLDVTDRDVESLRAAIASQEARIAELAGSERELRGRRDRAGDEGQRLLAKERRECGQLETQLAVLSARLVSIEADLRKSYQRVGRTHHAAPAPNS